MIQRSACRSYTTVASPSLFVWHPPPNPLQRVFVAAGPYKTFPVLSKIANALFTIWTKLFGPTCPFVSGGAELTVNVPAGPVKPWPTPSNDPFSTCDPLGFPRNLIAHAITSRGGTLFGSAPDRILIAYEQQRAWREIWMDGRALPKAVDVKGAPESRYYGYSVGHWENDNTLVIETTGLDERPWLDTVGHPRSSMALITERYTRVDQYNIQVTLTVTDPKYYSKPWTFMRASLYWMKAQEFPETLCIPSEAIEYLDTLAKPSGIQIVP